MDPLPIGEILTQIADQDPDRPAVTCGDRTVTRGELEANANRLARAYESMGVTAGQLVTVSLPNSIEFYESCFAIWKLGSTPQPVSWRLTASERTEIIELADTPIVVGADDEINGRPAVPIGYQPDPDLNDAPLDRRISPAWKASTSGGSTGRPKLIVSGMSGEFDPDWGTMLFGLRRDQRQLVCGPLYHTSPFANSMLGLYLGHHLIVLPRFDAEVALTTIGEQRIQYLITVPTMLLRMWRLIETAPAKYDLSSIERMWHLAAPCPGWLKAQWIELLGGDKVYELYGGTEQQAYTTIDGTDWLAHRGSVGKVVFGEMKAFDPDGNPLSTNLTGELYMRTPEGNPKTYRYIGSDPRTLPDRWESLGDMGMIDDEGYVFLTDRRDDMIIVGGANVYPAEVEAVILRHPQVVSCAVVGLPDGDLGERVHAVVQNSTPIGEQELMQFVLSQLDPHKAPRSVHFVDDPLRDDAGKVRRSAVRADEIRRMAIPVA
jgi:bile acid-coenzyme A ligase